MASGRSDDQPVAISLSRRALLAAAPLLAMPAVARAETWPQRPIRLIVPFAPGGNVDRIGRLLAVSWSEHLGQPCVVENRAGAGGTLGATVVEQSRPDGYTLLVGSDGALLLDPRNPTGFTDPLRRFEPIGLMSRSTSAVMVALNSPWQTVADMVAACRARPGQISAGHPGIGTSGQSTIRRLSRVAHIEMNEVAYRGGGDALTDVVAGNVPALFTELSTVLPLHQAGRARILAVAAETRIPAVPEVPTFVEGGFPGVVEGAFVGLAAPLSVPQIVLTTMAETLRSSLSVPGLDQEFSRQAILMPTPEQATPAGFRAFLVAKLADITAQPGNG
ncbi:MAG TPA: tripartite tricarboxylate transporter substrate binding protein [Roseomonas sp.]